MLQSTKKHIGQTLLTPQKIDLNKPEQSRHILDYKTFHDIKIKELDRQTNAAVCLLVDLFFESSQKVKNAINEGYIGVLSSLKIIIDIQISQKSIESQINQILGRQFSIVTFTKIVLNLEMPNSKNDFVNNNDDVSEPKIKNNNDKLMDQVHFNPKVQDFECPICYKIISNGPNYVKHLKIHDIQVKSQGYDCPHCQVSFKRIMLMTVHLFKTHFNIKDYKQTNCKNYYCPFTNQKFSYQEAPQLANLIRLSPHYTKVMDQIMVDQQQINQTTQARKIKFIPGVTKGIIVNEKQYGCPLCGLDEFENLKFLGGHIIQAHDIKYRNNFICPHCKLESRSARLLATHLISIHGKIKKIKGESIQLYEALNGEYYGDSRKLIRYIINDENYITLFNSACQSEPQGRIDLCDKRKRQ